MIHISKSYSVYMHVFPDKKKYIGVTSKPLRQRWNGGMGYENQKRVFHAIVTFGWENVTHYLLADGLDKESAYIIEAYLIQKWKTYRKSKGYNTAIPKIEIPNDFVITKIMRVEVPDVNCGSIDLKFLRRREKLDNVARGDTYTGQRLKKVRLIETGDVYNSAALAAREHGVDVANLYIAIRKGYACGTYEISGAEYGESWITERPAHWEYVEETNDF